jgi:hypothetical protein
MKNINIIGIDPGKNGGIARITKTTKTQELWTAHRCPKTIKEMVVILKMFNHSSPKPKCFLESVHAFPTDGRSSAFKFGMNFGIWQGILSALDIETILVTPQRWQKPYELSKIKKERKHQLKEIAIERSGLKVTLNTADAICIAIHGVANNEL